MKSGYFGGVEQNGRNCCGRSARSVSAFSRSRKRWAARFPQYQASFEECVPSILFRRPSAASGRRHLHPQSQRAIAPRCARERADRSHGSRTICAARRHKYYAWNGRICRHGRRLALLYGPGLCRALHRPGEILALSIGDKCSEMRRNQQLALLLVGSAAMREELIQNGFPRGRVEILPPVVRMPLRAMAPIPEENRIFLQGGQLIRGKGVDLLFRALPNVRGEYDLTIVGAGNERARLDDLWAKLGLGPKVRFEGWVNPQTPATTMRARNWSRCRPAGLELLGMIGLEAMHYGRPVVAFRVGGIPDWLEHGVTGLMAPEQDVRAFAAALEQLLSDPQLCSQLGQQAQELFGDQVLFRALSGPPEGLMSV